MKLSHLRVITAVAERGSLRAAARYLAIAQPAITRSIREAEHELGVALFERRPKGVVLTPMGQLFLRRAVAIQSELRQARDEIDQMRGIATGLVNIALSSAAQILLLPRTLEPFRKRYPDVSIRLREGVFPAIEPTLKDGLSDFYVGPLPEVGIGREFSVEKLFDNTRLIFGRKGHPMAKARSLRDLTKVSWIATSVTVDNTAELTPLFEGHGLPAPRIEIQASSALALILATANSDLLMMLPEQWLEFAATKELLQPFQLKETLPAAPICLVTRSRLPLTPVAEHFADLFRRASANYVKTRDSRGRKSPRHMGMK